MTFIVFSQSEKGFIDTSKLARHATAFFDTDIEVLERAEKKRPKKVTEIRIALRSPRHGFDFSATLVARRVQAADLRAARDAEARGGVPGLGALAEACEHVWEVHTGADLADGAVYLLCALLASVALGPILPPDHGTLLGAMQARARAEKTPPTYRA